MEPNGQVIHARIPFFAPWSLQLSSLLPTVNWRALRYFFLLWIKVTCNKKKKRNNLKVNSCTSDSLYSREEEGKSFKVTE